MNPSASRGRLIAAAPERERSGTQNYFVAHWRGELPLVVSFWINNFILSWPVGLVVSGLVAWLSVKGEALRSGSIAVLVAWPLMVALDVWCIVGAWRSASLHTGRGGSALWAVLARVVLALGLVGTVLSTAVNFLPRVPEFVQMARGIDPIGHVDAKLTPDGRRLVLNGPLGMGDATRVQALLSHAPHVRLVELESPGGRLHEGDRLAALVRERQLATRATGPCESACTLVFLAGKRRELVGAGLLGFHRASTGSYNPVLEELANRELAGIYRHAGLPEAFIDRTLRTPARHMWRPPLDELVAGGLVPPPRQTLDIELPPAAEAVLADVADALANHRSWAALEKRRPGTVAEAAGRIQAARQAGASDEVALLEGQRVVEGLLPSLLADAGWEVRERYAALLSQQLQAAQSVRIGGVPVCRALLAGDALVRRSLPPALAAAEAEWLVDAAAEPPRASAARAPNALEQEVLRRSLGERSAQQLTGAWGPHGAAQRDCARTQALLAEVLKLSVAERRLALRLMFERG